MKRSQQDMANMLSQRFAYLSPMARAKASELRACPFCRELFTSDETENCPECGVLTRDLAELPPSPDAQTLSHEENARQKTVPETQWLPWNHLGAGRGALLAAALVGFTAFFLPWAVQSLPENVSYSALDLARAKSFFWATLVAWGVLFPAVFSRRSIVKMVGARPACALLSTLPAMQVVFLLTRPTRRLLRGIPFEHAWGAGLWLTLAASLAAVVLSLRLGTVASPARHDA